MITCKQGQYDMDECEATLEEVGQHMRAKCPTCGKHIKFLKKTIPGGDDILYFGKYKGKSVSEVVREDRGYAQWATINLTKRISDAFTNELKKTI